jgi:hypothetical protein
MLAQWLAPDPVSRFVSSHLGKRPYARPGAAAAAAPCLRWETLAGVLERARSGDVLPVRTGRLAAWPAPRTLPQARALLDEGIGFVVRRAERHDESLQALADAFARDLPGDVKLQLFVTPGRTHGFGWHWDAEHVFLVQTCGVKDYFFRANSVSPPGASPDFGRIARETSSIATARLHAGDWLYIPARWWHVALCREESLSISIGLTPRADAR